MLEEPGRRPSSAVRASSSWTTARATARSSGSGPTSRPSRSWPCPRPRFRGRQQRRHHRGARRRRRRRAAPQQRRARRARLPAAAARRDRVDVALCGGVERRVPSRSPRADRRRVRGSAVRSPLRRADRRRQCAARRRLRHPARGRGGGGTALLLRAEALREGRPPRRGVLRLPRGRRLVPARPPRRLALVWEPHSRVLHRGSASTKTASRRPPDPIAPWEEQLPNAEPLPWNPVRAYLGARNVVRLLRTYATPAEQRHFARMCRRDLPLEFFAVVLGRLGWMRLGLWDWPAHGAVLLRRAARAAA